MYTVTPAYDAPDTLVKVRSLYRRFRGDIALVQFAASGITSPAAGGQARVVSASASSSALLSLTDPRYLPNIVRVPLRLHDAQGQRAGRHHAFEYDSAVTLNTRQLHGALTGESEGVSRHTLSQPPKRCLTPLESVHPRVDRDNTT